jgi:hypothetical protein
MGYQVTWTSLPIKDSFSPTNLQSFFPSVWSQQLGGGAALWSIVLSMTEQLLAPEICVWPICKICIQGPFSHDHM